MSWAILPYIGLSFEFHSLFPILWYIFLGFSTVYWVNEPCFVLFQWKYKYVSLKVHCNMYLSKKPVQGRWVRLLSLAVRDFPQCRSPSQFRFRLAPFSICNYKSSKKWKKNIISAMFCRSRLSTMSFTVTISLPFTSIFNLQLQKF